MTVDVVALIRKAAAATLNAQALVGQKATRDFAPTDLGGLDKSIKINKATTRGLVAQVYTDLEYALYQHEALDLRHDDGQAKFMEAGVHNERAAIVAAGAKAAKGVLG